MKRPSTQQRIGPRTLFRSLAWLRICAIAGQSTAVLVCALWMRMDIPLLPLMVGTGLTMSPGFDAAAPWLLDLFGGRQSARTLHFLSAGLIVAFIIVHVVMVVVSGTWNNIRSMITGRYAIQEQGPKS